MANLYNRVKFATSTSGTGEIIVGSAEDGYQTPISAGAKIGNNLRYVIEVGDNWEIGKGRFSIDYDTGTSFDPISQTTTYGGQGLAISTDGAKMYVVDRTDTYQYSLSTAYDLTTATYDNKTLAEGLYNGGNIFFKPDGTKVFYFAQGTMVNFVAYDLSTAWDITTAGSSISQGGTSSTAHFITGGTWNGDGTKLFVSHYNGQNPSVPTKIAQFNAATAYDHTSTSIGSPGDEDASVEIEGNFSQIGTGVFAIQWNSNGSELYVSDNNKVHVLTTSSYDISNLVYDRELIDADIYDFRSMYIKDDSNIFIGAWIASADPLIKKYDSTTANGSKIQRGLSESSTGSLLSLSGSNTVFLSASTEDLLSVSDGTLNSNIAYGVNKASFGPSDELEIYHDNSYAGKTIIKSSDDFTFQRNGSTNYFNFEAVSQLNNGPYIALQHTTTSPGTTDRAYVMHKSSNDAGENTDYSWIKFITSGVTDGSEDAQMELMTKVGGSNVTMIKVNGTNADVEIGDDGAVWVSSGTTAQRPTTGENGMIRYNTDDNGFEGYINGAWGSLGGGDMSWQAAWPNEPGSPTFRNIPIGLNALGDITSTAQGNVAVGDGAGSDLTTGTFNVSVGAGANRRNSTGSHNVSVGYISGGGSDLNTVNSWYNVSIGSYAQSYNTGGQDYNVGIGYSAMNDYNSDYSVAVGVEAMSDGNHLQSVGVGYDALGRSSTSYPYYNTAVGANAGDNLYSGDWNVVVGHSAQTASNGGNYATAVGGYAFGGALSVSVGYQAGYSQTSTSYYNALVGSKAGYDLDGGDYNCFIGYECGYNGGSGNDNNGVGYRSLYSLSSGIRNVTSGSLAVYSITSGNANFCGGYYAGRDISTGNNNTFVGADAGYRQDNDTTNRLTTGSNVTCIGYASIPTSGTATNEITLGDNDITSLRCNVQTISSLSDERDKTAIEDLPYGLEFINDMRPVKFTWNRRDGSFGARPDMGFIAQELAEVEADHSSASRTRLVNWENPSKLEADYARSYPILVKAVQELSAKCDALEARLATLEGA